MARRIPSLPTEWGNFFTCILLHMLLPLLPLLIETWMKGGPTASTISITAAMYSIAIGMSSKSSAMLAICILISIMFSAVFGIVTAGTTSTLVDVHIYSGVSILVVFIIHVLERYNRHVVDCTPFWEFS